METFQDYAYYYNAFYKDKDYAMEAAQIDELIKRYGSNVHTVINYGCGTGRHDIELSKLGYSCTDIRTYEPVKKYDAVISLFHVMSYQNTNKDILSAFQSARKSLEKGGLFLFDSWYGPGVLTDPPVVRVKETEDEQYRLVRVARPVMYDKRNVVDVCYEVLVIDKKTNVTKTINEVHSMRYFFKPELEMFLQQAGFELVTNLDCNSLQQTTFNSWTSYFIAKAK